MLKLCSVEIFVRGVKANSYVAVAKQVNLKPSWSKSVQPKFNKIDESRLFLCKKNYEKF